MFGEERHVRGGVRQPNIGTAIGSPMQPHDERGSSIGPYLVSRLRIKACITKLIFA